MSKGTRFYISAIVALVLLAKLIAAAICHLPATAKPTLAIDDILGAIVICTSHGAQPLLDDAGNLPDPGTPTSDHCPACNFVNVLALTFAAALLLLVFPHAAPPRPTGSWFNLLPDHLRTGSIRSRAPPRPA